MTVAVMKRCLKMLFDDGIRFKKPPEQRFR